MEYLNPYDAWTPPSYPETVRVVLTKGPGTSYEIAVDREVGPHLAPRNGVGGHEYLPHDLIHFVVEKVAGIDRGVFGELAAGGNGIFWPSDPAERTKAMRRRKKAATYSTPQVQADHERSEQLLRLALAVWEKRRGLTRALPADADAESIPPVVDRIADELDDHADHWHDLPVGEALTLQW